MTTFDELRREALALSVEQRALLAESLLSSLPPPDAQLESDELLEEERRNNEIESGQVSPISEAELYKMIEAKRGR